MTPMTSMTSMSHEARRRATTGVIGREAELARFQALLDADRSAIVWVFGPGGIGKSTLCLSFCALAQDAGWVATTVDLRAAEPTRAGLLAALEHAPDPGPRRLVVLDAFERVEGLEEWVRSDLLDLLPAGTIVAVASRHPPSSAWRSDPGWSSLLEPVPLRGLTDAQATELLTRSGVDAQRAAEGIAPARGHPLALVLLADVLRHEAHRHVEDLASVPNLVATLLGRILDEVPTPAHRQLLDAAAMTRVVTRGLVRHLFGADAADHLFEWLRVRSFMEEVANGVCPHDLVRDVLEDELRRTDPDAYARIHHQIREHLLAERARPGGARDAAQGIVYLHRKSSLLSSYWDWGTFGSVEATGLRAGDAPALGALVADAEVPILEHWMRRQPESFTVVRAPNGDVLGMSSILLLEAPTHEDLSVDPTLAAVWAHASRNDPPRQGQVVGVHRFFEDRDHGQGASATFNVVSWSCTQLWLSTPQLSWFYVAAVRDPDYWGPMMSYLDLHPVRDAIHHVGDEQRFVYCHDWRRVGPGAWLDLMESRELGGDVAPAAPAPVLVALDEEAFGAAVRAALRDLARPDLLAANPLARSRVARDQASTAAVGDDVAALLRYALAALPDDPRTDKARRAVERTYFHGTLSQEAAAEVLGMAFSTYRRHLQAGTALLVETLWRWELYGRG